jgi:hypothetical protein
MTVFPTAIFQCRYIDVHLGLKANWTITSNKLKNAQQTNLQQHWSIDRYNQSKKKKQFI